MLYSLIHCPHIKPQLPQLRLGVVQSLNFRPSLQSQTRNGSPAPQPPTAPRTLGGLLRDPASFPKRSLPPAACRSRPGTWDSGGREKRPYLSTASRIRHQCESGGAARPDESGVGGPGSGLAPQFLDGREHVGKAMSNSPQVLRWGFVIMREKPQEKADIISEF